MSKVDIIAEIGINHMGNMNIARKLIAEAAECGANIVKFQWYSVDALFGDPTKDTYNKEIYDTVKPFELNEDKIDLLLKCCQYEGIGFACSVFDDERFKKINDIVLVHKIASRVSKYDRCLAEKMLATGKPCYTSLGFDAERFDTKLYSNCRHLFCIAKYPTEYSDLVNMPKSFGTVDNFYGFSSHAITPYPTMIALARGALAVEVHFTLDKSMAALSGGFDHICSVDKRELKQICDFARHTEKLI
jgi:sialic acid synthase SpsE